MRINLKSKSNIFRIAAILLFALFVVFLCLSVREGRAKSPPKTYIGGLDALPIASLYKDDEGILAGTSDGRVVLFDGDGNIMWQYERRDAQGAYPVVRAVAIHGGRVFAAYGDRKIITFNAENGGIISWYTTGLEPQALYFGEESDFAVYADTNRTKAVYFFDAEEIGTESAPVAYRSDCSLNREKGLADGFKYLLMRKDVLYVSSENASVFRIDFSQRSISADDVEEVWRGEDNLLAVMPSEDGFLAIAADASVLSFDLDFKVLDRTKSGKELTAALLSDKIFVVKQKNGGIMGIDANGKESFRIDTGRNSLLIYASDESFAYLTEEGGNFYFIDTVQAIRIQKAVKLFPIFVTLCVVAALACAVFSVASFDTSRKKFIGSVRSFGGALYRHKFVYLSLIPTFLLLALFYYYPIIWGFGLSLFQYTPGEKAVFVGLANLAAVCRNTAFWQSFVNMFVLLITDLLKALIPPLIFAECILSVRSKKFSFWVRALLFIPGILPGVAGTLVWAEGVFGSGSSGLLNGALSAIFPSFVMQNWLQQESTALNSLIFFGFPWIGSYLIFYGAITGIPASMYEAAKLDGCGRLRRIISFDIPLIVPQIKYVLITSFIASVQDYGRIYITTQGDFGTNTPSLMMYLAITVQKNYGIASAMSIFLFVFLMAATVINFRMQSGESEG